METELLAASLQGTVQLQQLEALINGLEAEARIDLADEHQQQQLEGVGSCAGVQPAPFAGAALA